MPDAELLWIPDFLALPDADRLLRVAAAEIPWIQYHLRLFGRTVPQPRLAAWYGAEHCTYRYSGLSLRPLPFPEVLDHLRHEVNRLSGLDFNCALCNLYRTGADYVGWHSDDEPELGPAPPVASVSLGATRRFKMRHRSMAGAAAELELAHGSLLLMTGRTQHHWQHQVPRELQVSSPRVNITFRQIVAR